MGLTDDHLAVSDDNERVAQELYRLGEYRWTAVVAYYSAMHAAHARLAKNQIHPADHAAVLSGLRSLDPSDLMKSQVVGKLGNLCDLSIKARYIEGRETPDSWWRVNYGSAQEAADAALSLMNQVRAEVPGF